MSVMRLVPDPRRRRMRVECCGHGHAEVLVVWPPLRRWRCRTCGHEWVEVS